MVDFSFTEDDLDELPEEDTDEQNTEDSDAVHSVIAPDVELNGTLKLKHAIDFSGTFQGDIESNNTVNIKEEGNFEGKIDVFNLVIEGIVKGEMVARKRLEVREGGTFIGDLEIQPEIIILSEFASFGKDKQTAESFKKEYVRNRTSSPQTKEQEKGSSDK